jgi:hypothetical protein
MNGEPELSILQDSTRLHVFYRIALLLPLLGLALAAAVRWSVTPSGPPLAYGGRSIWIYPPSLIRGLLAYGLVIVWLYWHLRRRPLRKYETLLWQAPLTYTAVSATLLGVLVLAHGQAETFMDEYRGWMGLRLVAEVTIGYGYVALVAGVRNILHGNGYFVDAVALSSIREGRVP